MESSTISFLADLDKASDSRKANLCRSWKNAVLNEHGVYIDNRIDIDKYKTKKRVYPRITIHCALEYPKVYYSFDVMGENRGGGGLPGKESRNFDVHDHEANVALMVEQALREKITDDHKIPEKMIREVIEDFKAAIVSDDDGDEETEENRDENGWYICPKCGEKVANPVDSGLCYEKNKKKADEIRRSFYSEGWKEVPEEDYEVAKRNLCGWIDERKMEPMQKRPKQRYFWIDEISLEYAFCFLMEGK